MENIADRAPHVVGTVRIWLRLEGLLLFTLGLILYSRSGASCSRCALVLFVTVLAMLLYAYGRRSGAAAYSVMHSVTGPLILCAAAAVGWAPPSALPLAFIWGAHVGFDRALGYGLKYGSGFADTHLGQLGRARKAP